MCLLGRFHWQDVLQMLRSPIRLTVLRFQGEKWVINIVNAPDFKLFLKLVTRATGVLGLV